VVGAFLDLDLGVDLEGIRASARDEQSRNARRWLFTLRRMTYIDQFTEKKKK
jgi:hypothetical protein